MDPRDESLTASMRAPSLIQSTRALQISESPRADSLESRAGLASLCLLLSMLEIVPDLLCTRNRPSQDVRMVGLR